MSLTAILKKIEKVDQKHKEIVTRYNSVSKLCPRQEDLERQSLEDQRIFGYSSAQILGLFKQNNSKAAEETRPCTAIADNTRTLQRDERDFRHSVNDRRIKSAGKPAFRYKQQYNFLFKEDIFNVNCQKIRMSMPFGEGKRKRGEMRLAQKLKKQGINLSMKQFQKQALKEEKNRFIESFEKNLEMMQNRQDHRGARLQASKMTYEKKADHTRLAVKVKEEGEDFFRLTKTNFEIGQKRKLKINLAASVQNLKALRSFTNQREDSAFLKIDETNKQPLPFEGLYSELLTYLPQKFMLTCVAVPSLLSLKLNLIVSKEELMIEETKQKIDLKYLRESLLKQHDFIHLCFHSKDALLYDLYILNKSLIHAKNYEQEIAILSYHLKRFLLFDGVSSIQTVHESAQLMLKSNVDIPDEFFEFVGTFSKKMVHFYDKNSKYFTLCLKTIMLSGLKMIQSFKKQMGLGQKIVKLKHGTRREFRQFMYNWAYFYICLFPITIKNISICGSSSSSPFCSPLSSAIASCFLPLTFDAAPSSASKIPFMVFLFCFSARPPLAERVIEDYLPVFFWLTVRF